MPRNYSNVAEETSLASGLNNSATSIIVGSNTGYPSVPYSIIIDPGLATEEVCEVTAVAGTTWTVTRGVDGTPASSHDLGAVVVHGYSARDLRDIQDHVNDSTGVHGIGASSSVVGTIDVQTLTNKTLTSPILNGGTWNSPSLGTGTTFNSPILVTPTIASYVNAQHNHSDSTSGGALGTTGALVPIAYKRSATALQSLNITAVGDAGALPLSFGTLDYSVGNSTWATSGGDSRIVLPTDISDAVWHVCAYARIATGFPTRIALLNIVHQSAGVIASLQGGTGSGNTSTVRRLVACANVRSSSGAWIEIRAGSDIDIETWSAIDRSISIHRVA